MSRANVLREHSLEKKFSCIRKCARLQGEDKEIILGEREEEGVDELQQP